MDQKRSENLEVETSREDLIRAIFKAEVKLARARAGVATAELELKALTAKLKSIPR